MIIIKKIEKWKILIHNEFILFFAYEKSLRVV